VTKKKTPFEPTQQQRVLVNMMSLNGVKHSEQAKALGITPKMLKKHFTEEIEYGRIVTTANVANALYRNAMDGNVTAQTFFLKSQAGWREADKLEISLEGRDTPTNTEKEQRLASIMLAHKGKKTLTKSTTVDTFTAPENPN